MMKCNIVGWEYIIWGSVSVELQSSIWFQAETESKTSNESTILVENDEMNHLPLNLHVTLLLYFEQINEFSLCGGANIKLIMKARINFGNPNISIISSSKWTAWLEIPK